ncbi:Serine--tRNA ligase [Trichinella spiralis]|uniref:Serine--tRNA ligase n=1 Tax=Trichinella spiralis TaxID=6334 RepID=A0ABR3KPG5_TRISP
MGNQMDLVETLLHERNANFLSEIFCENVFSLLYMVKESQRTGYCIVLCCQLLFGCAESSIVRKIVPHPACPLSGWPVTGRGSSGRYRPRPRFCHCYQVAATGSAYVLPPELMINNGSAMGDRLGLPFTTMTWCNQEAWADLGLAIAGFMSRTTICRKYVPEESCVGQSLLHCTDTLDPTTRKMLLAFAQMVISWCYDSGKRLAELNSHSSCISLAMVDVVTDRDCLSDIIPPPTLTRQSSKNTVDNLSLFNVLSNFVGSYQSSTIICIYDTIRMECGDEAAELSLGPAVEELLPRSQAPVIFHQPTSTTETLVRTLDEENVNASVVEFQMIQSESRQHVQSDPMRTSGVDHQRPSFRGCLILIFCLMHFYKSLL